MLTTAKMVPVEQRLPNILFHCGFVCLIDFLFLLWLLSQEPLPTMVPGPSISRRDGGAIRSSSTSQVYASPIVIYHNSGTPRWNYSSPAAKSHCCRELPFLAQCYNNTPNCLPHATDRNIPPQLLVSVWIPKYRQIPPLGNQKNFLRIHRIYRIFLRDLENSSRKIKFLEKM